MKEQNYLIKTKIDKDKEKEKEKEKVNKEKVKQTSKMKIILLEKLSMIIKSRIKIQIITSMI